MTLSDSRRWALRVGVGLLAGLFAGAVGASEPDTITTSDEQVRQTSLLDDDIPPSPDDDESQTQSRLSALEAEFAALRSRLTASDPIAPPPAKPRYPTVAVNGAFQADTYWFGQDDANRQTLGFYDPLNVGGLTPAQLAALGDLQDGSQFRRARLSAKGSVAENVNYFFQMDFGFFGRPTFTDVWLEVTDVPVVSNVRVGQWKHPFSLEVVSSYRYTTFLERSSLFQAFVPFRHIGVGTFDHNDDETLTWAFSVLKPGNDQFGGDIGDSGGYSSAGRLTWLPFYEDLSGSYHYLHLGGAYWAGTPSNHRFRYASIPEGFVGTFGAAPLGSSKVPVPSLSHGTPPFVDTGVLSINSFAHFGLEAMWVNGPFSVQSEAMTAWADPVTGDSLNFGGMYLLGSWLVTGESRPYDPKTGTYDRIVPKRPFIAIGDCDRGPGAWEVAARFSTIDLNSGTVRGGRMTNFTAGVNWYLNGFTKMQFNYVRSFLDRDPVGESHADIYAIRAQVDF